MPLRLGLPTCSCLPTLGCGLVVLLSIMFPGVKDHHQHLSGSSPSNNLSQTPLMSQCQSAALLLGWLCLLAASDCITGAALTWHQTRLQAHKERRAAQRWQQQHRNVLQELQSTGLLSHMMRNADTRVLPWVILTMKTTETKTMTDGMW
eukprot:scaffold1982_cov93-Amphora_coffeaeformis.AAC.17